MAFSELICDDSDAAAFYFAAVDGGVYAAVVVAVVDLGDGCDDDDDDDDAAIHPSTCHSLSCVLPLVWPMLLMNWLPSLPLPPPSTLSIVSV